MSPPLVEKPVMSEQKEHVTVKEHGTVEGARRDGQPSLLSSAALIGIGALIEPELLVGMAVGAGIVYASKWLPDLMGGVLRPVVRTVVKAGYVAAEVVSEATEQVQDIVAEARAEREKGAAQH